MKDHRVFIKGDPEKNISFNEACFGYEEKNFGRCVTGVGSFAHEGDKDIYVKNVGNYATAYSFSASAAKVTVDMETGAVTLDDFAFGHDCGRPLNIRAVEGQIEGSVLLGFGFTCYEECVYDKKRQAPQSVVPRLSLPTALDMPKIKTFICSEYDPEGPLGAKGSRRRLDCTCRFGYRQCNKLCDRPYSPRSCPSPRKALARTSGA